MNDFNEDILYNIEKHSDREIGRIYNNLQMKLYKVKEEKEKRIRQKKQGLS